MPEARTGNHLLHRSRPKRLLLATDLQDLDQTLPAAIQFARFYDAHVQLLHVIPEIVPAAVAPSLLVFAQPEKYRTYARELLSAASQEVRDHGVKCTWKTEEGPLVDTLEHAATACKADWLIAGTHGATKFHLRILGSSAERIFRRVSLPVLAIGPKSLQHMPGEQRKCRVLIPLSLRKDTEYLIEFAALLMQDPAYSVTILHVLESTPGPPSEASTCSCEDLLHEHFVTRNTKEPRCLARTGDVTENIIEIASTQNMDLLVLGNVSASSFLPRLVPSSAFSVLCDAPCPVLVIRNTQCNEAVHSK